MTHPPTSAPNQGVSAMKQAFPQFLEFRLLAESDNGAVWSAWDPKANERVALKLIRDDGGKDIKERFAREYDILRSNPHPCLVKVFPSKGQVRLRTNKGEREHLWFTMELCHSDVCTALPTLPLQSRLLIIDQFLQGLCYLHGQNIAHRDIKPQNLFLVHPQQAETPELHGLQTVLKMPELIQLKIGDFGIAKDARAPSSMKTLMGVGTYHYMAPERFVMDPDADPDWRPSDQYAAGVTLYEILSRGAHPLALSGQRQGDTPRQVEEFRKVHEQGQIRPLCIPERCSAGRAESFPAIEHVITRMMAPDPTARYPHIRECVPELRQALKQSGL